MMRVGIYRPRDLPRSFQVYADNVEHHFPQMGVDVVHFEGPQIPADVDVLWDIRSGGGNPPLEFLLGRQPLVMTVHGFAPIHLSGWEYFRSIKGVLLSKKFAAEKRRGWQTRKDKVAALIAVSNFTKQEALGFTQVHEQKIVVCQHGVNEEFVPSSPHSMEDYFLHISNNEPRKNVDRIVDAFRSVKKDKTIQLKLKLPESQGERYRRVEGVSLLQGFMTTEELVRLYQHARGFVFPSLYEGFGMPILEAMACGCPVITSTVSACPEVAGQVALLVDPRNTAEIASAMAVLIEASTEQMQGFQQRGIVQASQFSWEDCARRHVEVFNGV